MIERILQIRMAKAALHKSFRLTLWTTLEIRTYRFRKDRPRFMDCVSWNINGLTDVLKEFKDFKPGKPSSDILFRIQGLILNRYFLGIFAIKPLNHHLMR